MGATVEISLGPLVRDIIKALDRQTKEIEELTRNLDEHLTSMVDYLATIAEAVGAGKS